jgi:acetyl esterase/lipase
MSIKLSLGFLLFFLLSSFSKVTYAQQNGAEKLEQLGYGPYQRNVMDVYLPANRTDKTPFVILIHGGAWTMSGKEAVRDFQDSLFAHGIAVASINHRYANDSDVHYLQMMQDVDRAVSYCQAHSNEWHTNAKNLVMAGASSGAHLALLYAYTTSKKIKAIVDFCGPTDLADTAVLNYSAKVGLMGVIQKMTGKPYIAGERVPAEFIASSPIYHIKNIPILIVHGTADPVVNFVLSQLLSDKLDSARIIHKLLPIAGAGHDLNLANPVTKAIIYNESVAWILKYGI